MCECVCVCGEGSVMMELAKEHFKALKTVSKYFCFHFWLLV